MKSIQIGLLAFALIGSAMAQNTASTKAALEKKLIEYGWDCPFATYVAENIRQMEKRPFDGIIFKLDSGMKVFDFDKPDPAQFEADFKACQNIQWEKFTDNFLIMLSASEQDWFNDEHWENILARAKLMAHAAKLARCVGICLDHEPYGTNPWSYTTAAHRNEKSFAEYEAKVRQRGAQLMQAFESELPGLTILTFFQLSYFANLTKPMDPAVREHNLMNMYYAFLPAFLNGMLDVASPQAQIVDGNENAYYYSKAEPYFTEYHQVRQSGKLLVAAENQVKYHNQVQVGQSLYVDYYFEYSPFASFCQFMTPDERRMWFVHNIFWALSTTDRYVWCYSEKMNWWSDWNLPAGAEDAIVAAKGKVSAGEGLGYTMDAIIQRAKEKEAEDFRNKAIIPTAEIRRLPAGTPLPTIDGQLNDDAWALATVLKPLTLVGKEMGKEPKGKTTVRVMFDQENLYFTAVCNEPNMDKLKTATPKHDTDTIWHGDDFEFFLACSPESTIPFIHLIVDPNGTTWDGIHDSHVDAGFNPKWQCATSKTEDAWLVEACVPWASLGMAAPAGGTKLHGNFARQNAPQKELSSWTSMKRGFLSHNLFGTFQFGE